MSSIVFIIFEILFDEAFMPSIDSSIFFISALPFFASSVDLSDSSFACNALVAFACVWVFNVSTEALSSSTELACSPTPSANIIELVEIDFAPTRTCSEALLISVIVVFSVSIIELIESLIEVNCPIYSRLIAIRKSPSERRANTPVISSIYTEISETVLLSAFLISAKSPL